uniref:Uncharacterized protein n=1 Tax=Clastoptera arizonana TaxID=38151 RepID=A0A1B6CZ91_9HEMI
MHFCSLRTLLLFITVTLVVAYRRSRGKTFWNFRSRVFRGARETFRPFQEYTRRFSYRYMGKQPLFPIRKIHTTRRPFKLVKDDYYLESDFSSNTFESDPNEYEHKLVYKLTKKEKKKVKEIYKKVNYMDVKLTDIRMNMLKHCLNNLQNIHCQLYKMYNYLVEERKIMKLMRKIMVIQRYPEDNLLFKRLNYALNISKHLDEPELDPVRFQLRRAVDVLRVSKGLRKTLGLYGSNWTVNFTYKEIFYTRFDRRF